MSYLDVIKYYYLSLSPRLRVPVPPSCVHRDRRPDQTVSGAPSPRFVFLFSKVFCFELFVSVPRQGSRHSSFRPSPRQDGVGVRRDRRESAGREPSCCGYSKPAGGLPSSRVAAPDSSSCPEEASASKPAQEGFLFLWAVLSCPCLFSPGGLSCPVPVCLAPEGCPVLFLCV